MSVMNRKSNEISFDQKFYPEVGAGGFTRFDGTIEFFNRVNSLISPNIRILDLGAGRGSKGDEDSYRAKLVNLKGKVAWVVGLDVDVAVKENPYIDEAIVYNGDKMPFEENTFDLVVSDWTLEHISNPKEFSDEIKRVLKGDGWLCARTPHAYSLLALVSSIIPNKNHTKILSSVQPDRQERDVFPTEYKLNTHSALKKYFSPVSWRNFSYTWSPEPAYHFKISILYKMLQFYQYIKRPFLGGECLFVFMRKR